MGFAASLIQVQIQTLPVPPSVILASHQTSGESQFPHLYSEKPAVALPPRPSEGK